jgi:glycosyltransferase involved in cell wall biosynthesis
MYASGGEGVASPISALFLIKHMDFGGGEYVFRTVIERLDRRAFRPVLACLTREGALGRDLRKAGIPVYANLLRHKLDLAVLLRLHLLIRHERAAVLYIMDYRDAMLWGALAGRMSGIKSILATHSTDWWGPRKSLTLVGKRFLSWHYRVVAVARFQKSHLVAHEGIAEEMVEIIPNGIDLGRYRVDENGASARVRFGLSPEAFVVGTVAVLRPEKNLEMLFAAIKRLAANGMDAYAIIVGDGERRAALEEAAFAMGIGNRVKFMGYYSDPAAVLPSFDVFTLTSHIEVMPITIMEAMACALPVVATAVGAVPEIIIDGETGFVIGCGDVDALAQRLACLAASPALARRMGQQGRERARTSFSLDAMIRRTELLLREAAGAGAS